MPTLVPNLCMLPSFTSTSHIPPLIHKVLTPLRVESGILWLRPLSVSSHCSAPHSGSFQSHRLTSERAATLSLKPCWLCSPPQGWGYVQPTPAWLRATEPVDPDSRDTFTLLDCGVAIRESLKRNIPQTFNTHLLTQNGKIPMPPGKMFSSLPNPLSGKYPISIHSDASGRPTLGNLTSTQRNLTFHLRTPTTPNTSAGITLIDGRSESVSNFILS